MNKCAAKSCGNIIRIKSKQHKTDKTAAKTKYYLQVVNQLRREIVVAPCILLFSLLKILGPWNVIPKSLIFVCAGNK